jgi:hypothetical protein
MTRLVAATFRLCAAGSRRRRAGGTFLIPGHLYFMAPVGGTLDGTFLENVPSVPPTIVGVAGTRLSRLSPQCPAHCPAKRVANLPTTGCTTRRIEPLLRERRRSSRRPGDCGLEGQFGGLTIRVMSGVPGFVWHFSSSFLNGMGGYGATQCIRVPQHPPNAQARYISSRQPALGRKSIKLPTPCLR